MISLTNLEAKLDYQFRDRTLLTKALTHRSYSKDHNERLEFLGDSLVNMFVAEKLFQGYPDSVEGHLSSMRAALVCQTTLAEIACEIDLPEHLILGGSAINGGQRSSAILSDTYEAIIAAVYLDGGWQACKQVVEKHFALRIADGEPPDINIIRDAKSLLQEWTQARSRSLPQYELAQVSGPGHAQHFDVHCKLDHCPQVFSGSGPSRRKAEQDAASQALAWLKSQNEREHTVSNYPNNLTGHQTDV